MKIGMGGCIAMDLVLQTAQFVRVVSHILPTSVFKADFDSNIAFAACETSYKGHTPAKLHLDIDTGLCVATCVRALKGAFVWEQ